MNHAAGVFLIVTRKIKAFPPHSIVCREGTNRLCIFMQKRLGGIA